jgi:hypothetical protein
MAFRRSALEFAIIEINPQFDSHVDSQANGRCRTRWTKLDHRHAGF